MSKDSVAVRIAGHEYKIRSEGDAQGLREIAGYVDRAMTRVRDRTGTVDTLDVAVLTCLNLAREILALHEERSNRSELADGASLIDEDRMRELIARVESTLVPIRANASDEMESAEGSDPTAPKSTSQNESGQASGEDPGVQAEAPTPTPTPTPTHTPEPEARMLDLPSFEDLRERAASRDEASAVEADTAASRLPAQRVAAGGRDRAS